MAKAKTALAYIRWFDSSITRGEPIQPEEAGGVSEMESTGLIIGEDKNCITLALDRSTTSGYVRCTICIPKPCVRIIKRFRA